MLEWCSKSIVKTRWQKEERAEEHFEERFEEQNIIFVHDIYNRNSITSIEEQNIIFYMISITGLFNTFDKDLIGINV